MSETLIKIISDGLTLLESRLKGRAAARLFDLNIVSENFMRDFLNTLRSLNLTNLNKGRKHAFPAIDLGDEQQRLSFQVTSDKSGPKIQKSLKTFVLHKLGNEYDRIQFIILREKQTSYASVKATDVAFDPSEDILDLYDLIRESEHCESDKLRKLAKIIQDYGLDSTSKIDELSLQAVRDFVTIDSAAPSRRQLVFQNSGPKTARDIYICSFLITEDGNESSILYDEIAHRLASGNPICQGDILTGDGRSNFLTEDMEYYKSTLNDRIKSFSARTVGPVRLCAVVRAQGDSIENTILEFWKSPPFDKIESAKWHHVHEPCGSSLFCKARELSDIWYQKRVEESNRQ
jgi:hypothetical protein